jgi:hypothetical protein
MRPVYWTIPWPRPLAELKHLQIAPLYLALLSEVTGGHLDGKSAILSSAP